MFEEYGDLPFIHWHHYERSRLAVYETRYGDVDGVAGRVRRNLVDLLPLPSKRLRCPWRATASKPSTSTSASSVVRMNTAGTGPWRNTFRDSLRGPRVNDRRSQAMTTRAGQRDIPEFLAVMNQGRRDLPHLRKARRATESQASRTESFSGSLLEDDSHCLRRIDQSTSLLSSASSRGVYAHRRSTENEIVFVMYASVPTDRRPSVTF